ncbi:MAG: hypothetical protein ACLFU8_11395 [Anaerolineales bacterium]
MREGDDVLLDPRPIARELGLDPAAIQSVEILSQRHGHAIWRLVTEARSYVLKWLPESAAAAEIEGYRLLQRLGVPTLPLYGSTPQALLLEDLTRSERWRLGTEEDLSDPEAGAAVARWYRTFHAAGDTLPAREEPPDFLNREIDALTPESILATGEALGLAELPVWKRAAREIEGLKAAVDELGVTLNYNDFYWTNLALSRREIPLQAIVFDYHLLGLGLRYSDCRNVTVSLEGNAVGAFWEVYGGADPREVLLDRPLATLFNLQEAARLPKFPRWAEESRQRVVNGELRRELAAAIEVARAL